MSKYTFICQETFRNNPSTRTVEFPATMLDDVVKEFEMFLKGCGFIFDGHLEIVQDDVCTNDEDDLDNVTQYIHPYNYTQKWPFPDSKITYEQGGDPAHPPSYQPNKK